MIDFCVKVFFSFKKKFYVYVVFGKQISFMNWAEKAKQILCNHIDSCTTSFI